MASESKSGEVQVERHGDVAVLRLLGEHDMSTVVGLREKLDAHASAGDGIVVSLAEAEFIESSVVKALFDADTLLQERGRRLAVHAPTTSPVRRVVDLTGLHPALPCSDSLEDALGLAAARDAPAGRSDA